MRRKNLFAFGVLRFANTPYNNGGYIYFGLEFYMDYRRAWHAGGTYFFTVNLLQRRDNDLLVKHIDILRMWLKKLRVKNLKKLPQPPENLFSCTTDRQVGPDYKICPVLRQPSLLSGFSLLGCS